MRPGRMKCGRMSVTAGITVVSTSTATRSNPSRRTARSIAIGNAAPVIPRSRVRRKADPLRISPHEHARAALPNFCTFNIRRLDVLSPREISWRRRRPRGEIGRSLILLAPYPPRHADRRQSQHSASHPTPLVGRPVVRAEQLPICVHLFGCWHRARF